MAVELNNCQHTVAVIRYITSTPPEVDIFMLRCFETPQTERLSAFVTVAEARGNVNGFFCGEPARQAHLRGERRGAPAGAGTA